MTTESIDVKWVFNMVFKAEDDGHELSLDAMEAVGISSEIRIVDYSE